MSLVIPLALSFGLLIGCLGLSLLALVRAKAASHDAARDTRTARVEQRCQRSTSTSIMACGSWSSALSQ